ncbi:MAG: hypothetical protein LBN24_07985 [Mediterranea sp.]|nr:hypothetical protein [Mediterranea sp.]
MILTRYFQLFVGTLMLLLAACTPDNESLGAVDIAASDLVEGTAFTVTHDSSNPNIVYLESKMKGYTPLWITPQGRSQSEKVTLKMPFEGTYQVTFGVMTRGGYVYGSPASFTIDEFYAGFINDELWTLLSGGVGNSKTWLLDLNADGQCKYFLGPLFFYGTDDSWETVTLGQAATDYDGNGAIDSWSWQADWAGNGSWLFSTGAMDYGSMTFNLINGANITVDDKASGTTYNGTYMLDAENHTIKLSDAKMIHDPGRDAIVTDWTTLRLLSLTENTMQLGVIRDNDPSEGPCLLVYNFISKEYSDNWTPPAVATPTEPVLPSPTEPQGTPLAVDNSKIQYGDLEGNGNLRIDIYNMYGGTGADPSIDPTALVFNSGIKIKFTINGLNGAAATGQYKAQLMLANSDWSVAHQGIDDATVQGDGQYTIQVAMGPLTSVSVFVIDIKSIASDITDISQVSATIDSIEMF